MKAIRSLILFLLLGSSIFLSYKVYHQEKLKQSLNQDMSELSDISYGLLNTDQWASLLSKAIAKQMDGFKISEGDEATLKKQISGFLAKAIDGFEKRYNKQNEGSGLTALFRRSISSFAGIFEQVKKDIPVFTNEIYTFLTESGTAQLLEEYISTELKKYTQNTILDRDYSTYNAILKKYNSNNAEESKVLISEQLKESKEESELYKSLLGGIFGIMMLLLIFMKDPRPIDYLCQILYSLSLLFLGVFLPMIAIDARITQMTFQFFGEQLSFNNQVLFYRSKSIFEVVEILFRQERWDLILVGGLILLFSVLFPISKLIASLFFTFSKKLKENKLVKFFVFKTGKWSMADVFVIALFMAYLGFDGILSEQLSQLQYSSSTVKVISTSSSQLLFGFYGFTAFVLLSLFISQRIKRLK